MYRPVNISNTGDTNLVEMIETFLNMGYPYNIIIGDFNMPYVKWKIFTDPYKNSEFLDCCTKHYLKQHVKEVTRPNSGAVLDLISTTVGTNVHSISIEETFGSSDHSLVNFVVDHSIEGNNRNDCTLKRNYNKANWSLLCHNLSEID